jgi:hypothetical protein
MLESKITPRGLGIEIESVVGYLGLGGNNEIQQSLADLFRANGLTAVARGYSHNEVTTDLCVETDSSLSFTDCPYRGVKVAHLEVKTRILNGVAGSMPALAGTFMYRFQKLPTTLGSSGRSTI